MRYTSLLVAVCVGVHSLSLRGGVLEPVQANGHIIEPTQPDYTYGTNEPPFTDDNEPHTFLTKEGCNCGNGKASTEEFGAPIKGPSALIQLSDAPDGRLFTDSGPQEAWYRTEQTGCNCPRPVTIESSEPSECAHCGKASSAESAAASFLEVKKGPDAIEAGQEMHGPSGADESLNANTGGFDIGPCSCHGIAASGEGAASFRQLKKGPDAIEAGQEMHGPSGADESLNANTGGFDIGPCSCHGIAASGESAASFLELKKGPDAIEAGQEMHGPSGADESLNANTGGFDIGPCSCHGIAASGEGAASFREIKKDDKKKAKKQDPDDRTFTGSGTVVDTEPTECAHCGGSAEAAASLIQAKAPIEGTRDFVDPGPNGPVIYTNEAPPPYQAPSYTVESVEPSECAHCGSKSSEGAASS